MIKNNTLTPAIVGLVLLVTGIFTGCSLPSYTPDDPTPAPTDPPQQTTLFGIENGERHFYTNEKKYVSEKGCTFWIFGDQISANMDPFEIQCYKSSGDQSAGYGVIFSVKDVDNYLTVLINVKGDYLIGKNTIEGFTEIQPWTSPGSSTIIPNYSSTNKIKVIYNAGTNHYEIYFNGTKETEFEDITDPVFDKVGRYGYIVCISPYENFPAVGTDVWFKQVSPVDIKLSK